MSEYTGQKSEAFRYLFKRISLLSCLCFFLFFFFILLIGEKVNTQWLSHAIFDPVVSWSYFYLSFLFHDFFCFCFVSVCRVSVCDCLFVCFVEWRLSDFFCFCFAVKFHSILCWFWTGENSEWGICYFIVFVCLFVCVCVLGVNVLLLRSVVVAVKGLVLCNALLYSFTYSSFIRRFLLALFVCFLLHFLSFACFCYED